MKAKLLLLSGVLAPLVYMVTVIVGGVLRPDYSHLSQAVSDLIASGAPNKPLLDGLFTLYNFLTLAFGVGLLQHLSASDSLNTSRLGRWGGWLLIAEAIFGLLTLRFPEPAGNVPPSFANSGGWHIVFASFSSLTTMLAIGFLGAYFWRGRHWTTLGLYSFISLVVVFVSGGLAAGAVANHSPLGGLLERITIGGYLQWLLGVALLLYWSESIPERLGPNSLRPSP